MIGSGVSKNGPTIQDLETVRQLAYIAARREGRSPFDADDIAQNTTLQIMNAWDRLRLDQLAQLPSWPSYVARAAHNRIIQDWRSESRRVRRQDRVAADHGNSTTTTWRVGTIYPRPEKLEQADEVQPMIDRLTVIDAAASLTSKQRHVVLHTLEDGLSVNEIAELYQVSPAAVKHRLERAIDLIQSILNI